jgi:hypothetical protein
MQPEKEFSTQWYKHIQASREVVILDLAEKSSTQLAGVQ